MSTNQSKSPNQEPSNALQFGVIIAFVILGIVGVKFASRDAKNKSVSNWKPTLNIKFQTYEQLALTTPTGDKIVDKMIVKRQKKVRSSKKDPSHWVSLGYAWVRKARVASQPLFYRNADACARVALSLDARFVMAFNLQALSMMQQHKFRKALAVARKILVQRKSDIMAWGTVSDALLELGFYEKATNAAQNMMDLKPNLPSYIRASHLMWLRGDFYRARNMVRHAYDAGRGQKDREPVAWVLTQAAWMHWHEGDYRGAGTGFDVALQQFPAYPDALVGKAKIAMVSGHYKVAVGFLEQAFKARSTAQIAWWLGDARMGSGDQKGAAKAYQTVERLGMRGDHRTLALFYATKNRKLKDALRYAKMEFKKRQDIYTEDAYAWALNRNGQYKVALKHGMRAIRLGTRDASLWFHVGVILIANEKQEAGLMWIKKALSLNPHFDETAAKEAKEILKIAGLKVPKQASLTFVPPPKKMDDGEVDLKKLPKTFRITRAAMKKYGLRQVHIVRKAPTTRPATNQKPISRHPTTHPTIRPIR